MKNRLFLAGALVATTLVATTLVATTLSVPTAQAAPTQATPAQIAPGSTSAAARASNSLIGLALPSPNGYDLIIEAAHSYLRGKEGSPAWDYKINRELNLKFQRESMKRNANVLILIRQALKQSALYPALGNSSENKIDLKRLRYAGLLLKQEGEVLVNEGEWLEAMNSSLDLIELGVIITRRAPLELMFLGTELEQFGRRDLPVIARHVDSDGWQAASQRLSKIESLRPPLADFLRVEKTITVADTRQGFNTTDWPDYLAHFVKDDGTSFTASEQKALNNLGESEVVGNLENALDTAIQQAELPYKPKARAVKAPDAWSRLLLENTLSPSLRVNYEANRAQNWLLKLAFDLRLVKYRAGVYPETLDTPLDPFSSANGTEAKLKYKRQGEDYLLYSVGPDAKNDGGAALIVPGATASDETASGDLIATMVMPTPTSTGDLLAPVL